MMIHFDGNKKRNCIACLVALMLVGCSQIEPGTALEKKHFGQDSWQKGLFGGRCEGSGSFKFKTFPLEPENVEAIVPMGRMQDSHVTPTDHQYILPKVMKSNSMVTENPEQYKIMAPADGYIISVEIFKEPIEEDYKKQE